MKFGSQLKDTIYPEWAEYYIDYEGLKKRLRKAERDQTFTERDETEFVELLDSNLEMVYAFYTEKIEEIKTSIDNWDEQINTQMPSHVDEMGSIQENINWIADDINHLARYSRINYTGFLKIVKKHDRYTNYLLRPMFMVRLNQCPFWKEDNDALLIKLSKLFSKVRQGGGGKSMSFKPSSSPFIHTPFEDESSPRRLIIKRFIIQPENVLELKTFVLRHLPVLIYHDSSKNKDDIDPPISSLYLDNAGLDAYNSRVEAVDGSQIIRLRWYGQFKNNKSIIFERRTLNQDNNGELKDRFIIKEKYIAGFLKGDNTFVQKSIQKLKNNGKSQQDIDQHVEFINSVQTMIIQKKMEPVLRTYYHRTAFQIPGDKSVRMALDTDLCFIREDSGLFPDDSALRRSNGDWCRPDVDNNFPFKELSSQEINRYPFATFEIKLELTSHQKEPEWIVELEESGLLEQAYDFTKFVHGIAVMFDTRVPLLPYWLAQIDDEQQHQLPLLPSNTPSVVEKTRGHEVANENSSLMEPSTSKKNYMGTFDLSTSSTTSTIYEEQPQESLPSRIIHNFTRSFNRFIHHLNNKPYHEQSHSSDSVPVILPPGVKVPKKVFVPLRVEPKVFFANERTYFSWMSFGTLLSTFSLALFNSGDAVGKLSGVVYTLISISTLMYGMGLYYRRRELIHLRAAGPYDEVKGPTAICFALLFAVALNAYLKFSSNSPTLFYL